MGKYFANSFSQASLRNTPAYDATSDLIRMIETSAWFIKFCNSRLTNSDAEILIHKILVSRLLYYVRIKRTMCVIYTTPIFGFSHLYHKFVPYVHWLKLSNTQKISYISYHFNKFFLNIRRNIGGHITFPQTFSNLHKIQTTCVIRGKVSRFLNCVIPKPRKNTELYEG